MLTLISDIIGGGQLDWERAEELIGKFEIEEEFVERIKEGVNEGILKLGEIDPVAVALEIISEKAHEKVEKLTGIDLPEVSVYGNFLASSYEPPEKYTVDDFEEALSLLQVLDYPEVEFVYGESIERWIREFINETISEIEDDGWGFATDGSKLFIFRKEDGKVTLISEEGINNIGIEEFEKNFEIYENPDNKLLESNGKISILLLQELKNIKKMLKH